MIQFIKELSDYYSLENDLSNITCILCRSNLVFKKLFLKFFFSDININDVHDIIREVPDGKSGDSRVDIYISMDYNQLPYF